MTRRSTRANEPSATPLERCVATTLAFAIALLSPGAGLAGGEFESADQAVMLTEGSIDNSIAGETTITSTVEDGRTFWAGGLDQPEDNVLLFDLVSPDSTHYNVVGGDFAAHLNGQVRSVDPDAQHTIVFASPFGVFIGDQAVIDVGTLVAVGADLTDIDRLGTRGLALTGPVANAGLILADDGVFLYGSDVTNTGRILTPAGRLLLFGGDALHFLDAETIAAGLRDPIGLHGVTGDGRVHNAATGVLDARDATLLGRRIANDGHIEIADGTLVAATGDLIQLRRFDDPVVVSLPRPHAAPPANHVEAPEYAIEQRGTIDAGAGRVRLAAADPLGWGLRQQAVSGGAAPAIRAATIELDGGADGRVVLSGTLDASNAVATDAGETDANGSGATGGRIDVTGESILLVDGTLDASGEAGGGTIHVGGEQQGKGDLPRSEVVVADADSTIRADALRAGDGGRVIVFAESLTHLAGDLSARGGAEGGDGGFIETSGLAAFHVERTPDASAPAGEGGEWLIDPYTIEIVAAGTPDVACPGVSTGCLNAALEQILRPGFDDAGFDAILRTFDETGVSPRRPNDVTVDLLVRALAAGVDVTLSTESFGISGDPDEPTELAGAGDILVNAAIDISDRDAIVGDGDAEAAPGTRATLSLLAAGDIEINQAITVGDSNDTPDMALSLELRANDQSQRDPSRDFADDQLLGSVAINADIRTGGGDVLATGVEVAIASGATLRTDGGDVFFRSGSLDRFQEAANFVNTVPSVDPGASLGAAPTPGIEIAGAIDTRRADDAPGPGGEVQLEAGGLAVRTRRGGNDALTIWTGELRVDGSAAAGDGTIRTGGGLLTLEGGVPNSTTPGNVTLVDAILDTGRTAAAPGGAISIEANRLDPDEDIGAFDVELESGDEGGAIEITSSTSLADTQLTTRGGNVVIGGDRTRSVGIAGRIDTTRPDGLENGLIAVVAQDAGGFDADGDPERTGEITLGTATVGADLQAAGVSLRGRTIRSVTSGEGVSLRAIGETTGELDASTARLAAVDTDDFAVEGDVRLDGEERIDLAANTRLRGERVVVLAAADPTDLDDTSVALPERLVFGGSGGTDATAGVRLAGDAITITVGDGTSASEDLFDFDPVDDPELARAREGGADWSGLQLRDEAEAARPETIAIRQDADLTLVAAGTGGGLGRLDLGGRSGAGATSGAFGDAAIGAEGQTLTIESADGLLTVEDAAALSRDAGRDADDSDPSDAGRSFVTLHGGLLLNDASDVAPGESLAFAASLPDDFRVDALTLTSPRALTITAAEAAQIVFANDLTVRSGRRIEAADAIVDGDRFGATLTIEAGTVLRATDRVALLAGGQGFDDLVFEAPAGTATRIESNAIELRAGAGVDSRNGSDADRSAVLGANAVEYAAAAGGAFERGATNLSFSLRQDAAIDAATHLPTIDDFTTTSGDFTGAGGAEAVDYALRADFGTIDLSTGGFGPSQLADTDLSLIGRQSGGTTVLVGPGDVYDPASIVLGGVGDFTFGAVLEAAFNPDTAIDGVTLRAGLNTRGTLSIASGTTVRGPSITLAAGDGVGGTLGSAVSLGSARFDFGATPGDRVFVYQEDQTIALGDLPDADQFEGGVLPSVLAIRNDGGTISFTNVDLATDLPLDLTAEARLVLEAAEITLAATGTGEDLNLTGGVGSALENLRLRLRTDDLVLSATGSGGEVVAGTGAAGPVAPLAPGADASFSGERLLIEAFDRDADLATTDNLSVLSEDPLDADQRDLSEGRGPTSITIDQDAAIGAANLPKRWWVSGELARGADDDDAGDPIPTILILSTRSDDAIRFTSDEVAGGDLLVGAAFAPTEADVFFDGGGSAPGFDFANVAVFSLGDVTIASGADLSARGRGDDPGTIQLEAGVLLAQPTDTIDATPENRMGRLIFEGAAETDLAADEILLRAGPTGERTNPDGPDAGSERDDIPSDGLAQLELDGLRSIATGGGGRTTRLLVTASGPLDADRVVAAMTTGGTEWDATTLASVQDALTLSDVSGLAAATRAARLGQAAADDDARVEITRDAGSPADLLSFAAGFEEGVTIESNDIRFIATGADQIVLDTPNLQLLTSTFRDGFESESELGRTISDTEADEDALERARLTITQDADFSSTTAPRRDAWFRTGLDFFTREVTTTRRGTLSDVEIVLATTGPAFVFGDALRDGVATAHLGLRGASGGGTTLSLAFDELAPGVRDYAFDAPDLDALDFPVVELASLDVADFAEVEIADFTPPLPAGGGATIARRPVVSIETSGDQRWDAPLRLGETLSARGRDLVFTGDIDRDPGASLADVELWLRSDGDARFEGDLGATERLGSLFVLFDSEVEAEGAADPRTPAVQFGRRLDGDGDGIAETPVDTDQIVRVDRHIVFGATPLSEPDDPRDLEDGNRFELLRAAIEGAANLDDLAVALADARTMAPPRGGQAFALRRSGSRVATVGKALGDLTFESSGDGHFVAGSGERIAVGGRLAIDFAGDVAAFGDVAALDLDVIADEIGLVRRSPGVTALRNGATAKDRGAIVIANDFDFGGVTPQDVGRGKRVRFAVPNPYDTALPGFVDGRPVVAIAPDGGGLTLASFVFAGGPPEAVPFPFPTGASRSELSGAFGPDEVPIDSPQVRPRAPLAHPDRLRELRVEPKETPASVRVARLGGAAIIDDVSLGGARGEDGLVRVTATRLDARDAEAAIALYETLFGRDGEHADRVRAVLQDAIDAYLETTRARRVIGFELRRFVKNRPSTLLEAYRTLDQLDSLFRYHRRLGLSPGEYRAIQADWLRAIQPEGIALDELAEAIHPSRYVRGSDILDIFGR